MSTKKIIVLIVVFFGLILIGYGVFEYTNDQDQLVNKPRAELRNSDLSPQEITQHLKWEVQTDIIIILVGALVSAVSGLILIKTN
jgi:hypothetical protein